MCPPSGGEEPHARIEAAAGGNQRQSATPRGAGASRRPDHSPAAGRVRAAIDVLERDGSAFPGELFGFAILQTGVTVALKGRSVTITRRSGERVSIEIP